MQLSKIETFTRMLEELLKFYTEEVCDRCGFGFEDRGKYCLACIEVEEDLLQMSRDRVESLRSQLRDC